MAYRGNWLQRSWERTPPEPLHQADPRHAQSDPADPTIGGWSGPPILDTNPAPYIVENVSDWVVQTDGLQLDFTPQSHYDGFGTENYTEGFTVPGGAAPGDVEQAAASGYAHGTDYGASRASNYAPPPFQAADERYLSSRFEGVGPVELPQLVGGGMRGLNSYGVNNPGLESYGGAGYRRGWVDQSWVDRKMYDPMRIHDERLVLPNVATIAMNQPVPQNAGPYNSPFDSLARIIQTVTQKPMLRRSPPPIEQSIMEDGTGQTYDAYESDWVAG